MKANVIYNFLRRQNVCILFIILLITIFFSCSGKQNKAEIYCEEKIYDYGVIKQGSNRKHTFCIINKGNVPLTINKVVSSCGCTTVDWTKNKINPKNKGFINVKYNTNKLGDFYKTIVVKSNAVNDANYILKIKGKVVK